MLAGSDESCSQHPNAILFSGTWFAALDGTSPNDSYRDCQLSFTQLPAGWILAVNNDVSQNVIQTYPWGTFVMAVADGFSYWTYPYSGPWIQNVLISNGNEGYVPKYCDLRVLIQCAGLSVRVRFAL